MTQPTTAASTSSATASGLIPAQRAVAAQAPESGERTGGLRRALAIVRGLRSLGSVPAAPRIGYGESDGQ